MNRARDSKLSTTSGSCPGTFHPDRHLLARVRRILLSTDDTRKGSMGIPRLGDLVQERFRAIAFMLRFPSFHAQDQPISIYGALEDFGLPVHYASTFDHVHFIAIVALSSDPTVSISSTSQPVSGHPLSISLVYHAVQFTTS